MIKDVLRDIGGIGLYGVVSVCLFFVVFTAAVIRALAMRRQAAEEAGRLPLTDETQPSQERLP
ncbi:MAG TPA: CcoQ/FixQ family Cbb3-type cytochrome c oxidase assembly chaperone [Verrucomicrobiota bacterium]|nr:CcoQ/FixQ family Cbb3-type cytochrome c oxidase assembly chaperone [Verrucomicrobiota bacterium]